MDSISFFVDLKTASDSITHWVFNIKNSCATVYFSWTVFSLKPFKCTFIFLTEFFKPSFCYANYVEP